MLPLAVRGALLLGTLASDAGVDRRALRPATATLVPARRAARDRGARAEGVTLPGATSSRDAWQRYVALVELRRENDAARATSSRSSRRRTSSSARRSSRAASCAGSREMRDEFEVPMLPAQVVGQDASPWFRSRADRPRAARTGCAPACRWWSTSGLVGLVTRDVAARRARDAAPRPRRAPSTRMVQRSRARGIVRGTGAGELRVRVHGARRRRAGRRRGDHVRRRRRATRRACASARSPRCRPSATQLLHTARMRPAVDFGRLEQVFVMLQRGPTMDLLSAASDGDLAGAEASARWRTVDEARARAARCSAGVGVLCRARSRCCCPLALVPDLALLVTLAAASRSAPALSGSLLAAGHRPRQPTCLSGTLARPARAALRILALRWHAARAPAVRSRARGSPLAVFAFACVALDGSRRSRSARAAARLLPAPARASCSAGRRAPLVSAPLAPRSRRAGAPAARAARRERGAPRDALRHAPAGAAMSHLRGRRPADRRAAAPLRRAARRRLRDLRAAAVPAPAHRGRRAAQRALRNSVRTMRLEAPRGEIVDREGRVARDDALRASSSRSCPSDLRAADVTFAALAQLLEREPAELVAKRRQPARARALPGRCASSTISTTTSSRASSRTATRCPACSTDVRPRRALPRRARWPRTCSARSARSAATSSSSETFAGYRSGRRDRAERARVDPRGRAARRARAAATWWSTSRAARCEVLDEVEPRAGRRASC